MYEFTRFSNEVYLPGRFPTCLVLRIGDDLSELVRSSTPRSLPVPMVIFLVLPNIRYEAAD